MSQPPNSSSSDDEATNFRSNVHIPAFVASKPKKKPSSTIGIKRIGISPRRNTNNVQNTNPHYRRSMLSNSSTRNSSSSDILLEKVSVDIDPVLPSFMNIQAMPAENAGRAPVDITSLDSEDPLNDQGEQIDRKTQSFITSAAQNSQFYETDSSDEDDEEAPPQRRASASSSFSHKKGGLFKQTSRSSTISMLRDNSQGTDITDQRESKPEEKPSGIKGILRKMSLVPSGDDDLDDFQNEIPSTSETFLGRVLSFQNSGGLGLNGGGLAPGATRREPTLRNIDEESEIGLENDEEGIELKRMDFAKLSAEAHNLISLHVPNAHTMMMQLEQNTNEKHLENDEKTYAGDSDIENASTPSSNFLTANPDYFLRGDAQNDVGDDYMLLDEEGIDGYIAPPKKVQSGVLSSLLKLYQNPLEASKSSSSFATTLAEEASEFSHSLAPTKPNVGNTASKLKAGILKGQHKVGATFKRKDKRNVTNSSNDVQLSSDEEDIDEENLDRLKESVHLPSFQNAKPKIPKKKQANVKVPKFHKKNKKNKLAQQLRITVHIADFLQRQRFILRMCKALMLFGAPTHRLEEYMIMTSRVLEIDGQFMYFPGCMIVAFGDAATRTSEVHLIRCAQGLNLSKLADTHKIYKAVIHDLAGIEESSLKLEELLKRKNLYNPWICVFLYGLGSSMVAPFAFGAGWYDIPICFLVGLCVGYLQFFVSSKSNLYSSVFEVSASIAVSFIARGIGSIGDGSGNLFCFAAIAQGSLALILPGYIILCGSLELQSRNLVAGSVRMFYAIIYSLFLGFGITLGAALYGWVDKNSTSVSVCPTGHNMDPKWRILFIPMYSMCLGLINQASFKQLPVQILISSCGYVATYFAGKHFSNVTEFTAAIGAFIVGIMGNMYSRIWKGMAVSAMLPAIFVQVPSGIASQSTLLTGIATANQITNGTASPNNSANDESANALLFGATMVEVSIGISVGLFAAALVVYPFGKKRTGLFTL